jgi:hypothetical protein
MYPLLLHESGLKIFGLAICALTAGMMLGAIGSPGLTGTEVSPLIRFMSNMARMGPTLGQQTESSRSIGPRREDSEIRDEVKIRRTKETEDPILRIKRMRSRLAPVGTKEGDRNEDLRRAMNALPRDHRGTITPDILVDEGKTAALSQAIERLVLEGLGSGADIAFEHAVDSLFDKYSDDLSLDAAEFTKAKELMLKEVRDVVADNEVRPWDPNEPAPAETDLESTVSMLQEKVLWRRRMMLEASGDLSRVLAELTVTAQAGDTEDLGELGHFLERFGQAIRARSAKDIRDEAKDRLLSGTPLQTTAPAHTDWGQAFLERLEDRQLA